MDNIYESELNDIHSSACVSQNAIIGKNNTICEGVIIRDGVQIGDNNYIGPYCIIGDFPEKIGYLNKLGKVVIGNNNHFTKQVTIDSGTDDITIIKNQTIMLKNAHVGHDAYIETGVILSCDSIIGGGTKVGKNANLGLGAVVHQRLNIPEGVIIGMNSTVTKRCKLEPGRKYAGSPIRDIGENKR